MKPFYFDLFINLSAFAIDKIDTKIDTEEEQAELAKYIIESYERRFGDIPWLSDDEEFKRIKEGIMLMHKGLNQIKEIIGEK